MEVDNSAEGGLYAANAVNNTQLNAKFWAVITDYDSGTGLYGWTEQQGVSPLTFVDQDGGRSGSVTVAPAYEANGQVVDVGKFVEMKRAYFDDTLDWVFVFVAPGASTEAALFHGALYSYKFLIEPLDEWNLEYDTDGFDDGHTGLTSAIFKGVDDPAFPGVPCSYLVGATLTAQATYLASALDLDITLFATISSVDSYVASRVASSLVTHRQNVGAGSGALDYMGVSLSSIVVLAAGEQVELSFAFDNGSTGVAADTPPLEVAEFWIERIAPFVA